MLTEAVRNTQSELKRPPKATEAIAACGGDAREAVKALIVANAFLVDHRKSRQ
jgi:hypothetical protein